MFRAAAQSSLPRDQSTATLACAVAGNIPPDPPDPPGSEWYGVLPVGSAVGRFEWNPFRGGGRSIG
jgi:hypothetical protein